MPFPLPLARYMPTCFAHSSSGSQPEQPGAGERLQNALDVGAQPLASKVFRRELPLLGHLGRFRDCETDDEAVQDSRQARQDERPSPALENAQCH